MKTKKRLWQVWTEEENPDGVIRSEKVLYQGTETKCKAWYKSHGGNNAGLHIGYPLFDDDIRVEN